MKVALGCDHAGVNMKNEIIPLLEELGIEWKDVGTKHEESCDYPDYEHAHCCEQQICSASA